MCCVSPSAPNCPRPASPRGASPTRCGRRSCTLPSPARLHPDTDAGPTGPSTFPASAPAAYRGYHHQLNRATTPRRNHIGARKRSGHRLDAAGVLVVRRAEDHDHVGQLAGAHAAHVRHAGAARQAHQQSLAIRERLAKTDPSNSVWQHELSLNYMEMPEFDRLISAASTSLGRPGMPIRQSRLRSQCARSAAAR